MNTIRKLIYALIATTILHGSTSTALDVWGTRGPVWALLDDMHKMNYVSGMFDIIVLNDSKLLTTDMSFSPPIEVYIQGIDKHYEDYRNQLVPAVFLLEIVGMEILGASEDAIENLLQDLRATFANLEN